MSEEFDTRLKQLEKRVRHLKWLVEITLVVLIIATVHLFYVKLNLQSEKKSPHAYKAGLKEGVEKASGYTDSQPELVLLGANRNPLQGQNIMAIVGRNPDKSAWLSFRIIERNQGGRTTGPVFLKVYTSDPIILGSPSTDEPDFHYEGYVTPERRPIPALRAGVSVATQLNLQLLGRTSLSGTYPALIKAYYGDGQVAQAYFNLEITGK
ncbi:MAG: hypothetical protein AB1487_04770 [Thermodesulfobacteriota bacterium]